MIKNLLFCGNLLFKQRKGMSTIVSIIIVLSVAMIIFVLINNWSSLANVFVGQGAEYASEALLG